MNFIKKLLKNNSIYILLGFSFIGIFDTTYLLYNEFFNQGQCNILGGSCEEVLNSEHSKIFMISISAWGLIYYMSLFIFSYKSYFINPRYFFSIFIMAFIGSCFSWYLFYLQWKVIKAWCPLCLISFANANLVLIYMIILHFLHSKKERLKINLFYLKESLKTVIMISLVLLLVYKLAEDVLNSEKLKIKNIDFIVGIIDDDYIEIEEIDVLIRSYIFVEKRKINKTRIRALEFILLKKAAKKNGLELSDYLVKEKVIKDPQDYKEFIRSYFLGNDSAKEVIEKLKKEFFYREIIY